MQEKREINAFTNRFVEVTVYLQVVRNVNRMKKKLLFPILFIVTMSTYGQTPVKGTSYTHFQIKSKNDIIDFVIADTNLNEAKPLLLFCQGSQPVPLFIDFGEQDIWPVPLNNFNLEELNKNYHVAVISMPKTPLMAKVDELNNRFCYVTDTSRQHNYATEYLKADYLENYVKRANTVLKFLRKQSWIHSSELVVAGHSQGARIAVGIASSNKNVTHLGLFGYNPMGRIVPSILQIRKKAEAGEISWETADSLQQEQYDFYALLQNPDSIENQPGLTSWKSFSKPTLSELVKLKIPVYIAYGSEDPVADFCDLLPLHFIEEKKTNYYIKRYPHLEHNFFPIDENGKPNHSEGKWELVMNEFIRWSKNTSNPQ